jgi:hypothetical protein
VAGPLWTNELSTYYGINDQVPEATANAMRHSLLLIRPDTFRISIAREGGTFALAKRKVRGYFSIANIDYKLSITDPFIEHTYLSGEDGQFSVANAILCISLGEIFNGYAYKLIATVITPERAEAADV